MRSEAQMMELILSTAQKDDRIRAVWMNGSRTNPNAPRDLFMDFDVVYVVTEMDSFLQNPAWIDRFGKRIILQTPEDMHLFSPSLGGRYTYLMLFEDGNRIDLMLVDLKDANRYVKEDKLTMVLLDKDGILPKISSPSDEDYHVTKPDLYCYNDCCNEFWWVSTYVAKGLWREEILYALYHLNQPVNHMLLQMLSWLAGIRTDFSVSTGKCGKYLKQYLTEEEWAALLSTYPRGTERAIWEALFSACTLFSMAAKQVAKPLGFCYSQEQEDRVLSYLYRIRNLPKDAKQMIVME
jgi:aminoglycoside 6-adenylyltransferase